MLHETGTASTARKRRTKSLAPYDPQAITPLEVAWSKSREMMYLLSEYQLPQGGTAYALHRGFTSSRLALLPDTTAFVTLTGDYHAQALVNGVPLQLQFRPPLHDSVLTRITSETKMFRCGVAGFDISYHEDSYVDLTMLTKVVDAKMLEELKKAAGNILEAIEAAKRSEDLIKLRSIGPGHFLKPLRKMLSQEDEPERPATIDQVYLTMLEALASEYEDFLKRSLMLNANKFCARFYLLVKLMLDSANIDIPEFPGLSLDTSAANDSKRV